jgi:YebC/PmpR family DNA-binding regulatory protein
MSGHSKWSTIKHKKGAEDKRRGQLFTKLSRAIIVAAKEGGSDPEANATLAAAITKARSYSMPKDNIERAIARATGGGEGSDAYETVTYEGYGPEGVAIIVEALTDNRNRTAADVRSMFTRANSSLGTPGSVAWQFERKGVILVPAAEASEDDVVLAAADAGAEDVAQDESSWQVTTAPTDLAAVRDALEAAGIPITSADLTMAPKTTVELDETGARQLLRLIDSLEDLDDVQEVHANFDIPEAVLEAAAG